jgi:hypothetical protein
MDAGFELGNINDLGLRTWLVLLVPIFDAVAPVESDPTGVVESSVDSVPELGGRVALVLMFKFPDVI